MTTSQSPLYKNILITGVKGKTGSRVFQKLKDLPNLSLRGVSRSTNPAFDWEDASTWQSALTGMQAVYISYQPDLAVPGAPDHIKQFTALAAKSGIQKIVLLSGRGEEEARACEQIVMNAGIDWTIIRASWFNQNFSEGHFLDPILAGHVALPINGVKEPFVDTDDIADVAVAALTHAGHTNKLYEVTGPRLLTFAEAIAEISTATNRNIVFEPISPEAYTAMLTTYGVPSDHIALVNYLFTEVLDGRNESTTTGVREALGRPAKDFKQYVAQTAERGIWNE